MRFFLKIIRALWRRLRLLFGRRDAHLEIAILGASTRQTVPLAGALLEAERGGANILHSDCQGADQVRHLAAATSSDGHESDDDLTLQTIYLTADKPSRRRRWLFHIPSQLKPQAEDEDTPWRAAADAFVICWPYDRLGCAAELSTDLRFHLTGVIGNARERGRLRRVAVVITGMPRDIAPRHKSQVRLDLPRNLSIREAVEVALARSALHPGDGLADPSWRRFLTNHIAKDEALGRLTTAIHRCLNRDCPVFFDPPKKTGPSALADLLEWLHGKGSHPASGLHGLVRALTVIAVLAATALAGLAILMPRVPGDSSAALSGSVPDSLHAHVREQLDAHEHRTFRLAAFLPNDDGDSAKVKLQEAQNLLSTHIRLHKDALSRISDLRSLTDYVMSLNPLSATHRSSLADSLARYHEADITRCDDMSSTAAFNGITFAMTPAWHSALGPLSFQAALLSYRYPTIADSTGIRSEGCIADSMASYLRRLGMTQEAAFLDSLACTSSVLSFYRICEEVFANETYTTWQVHPEWSRLLPRPHARGIIDRALSTPLVDLVAEGNTLQAQLSYLLVAADWEMDGIPLVDSDAKNEVQALLDALGEVLPPREVEIKFSRSTGERSWHVICQPGNRGSYHPAIWLDSNDPSRMDGCLCTLLGKPGDELAIWLDRTRDQPITDGSTLGPPLGSSKTIVILDARSGSFDFPEAVGVRINYEILSDWPSWPPIEPT